MIDQPSFERRVGTLLRTIADDMPIDVDPMEVTQLAAADRMGVTTRFGFMPGRFAIALLLLALVAAMAGSALVGSRFLQRDAEDVLLERAIVEPFDGLPPEGTPLSTPETGELVLRFAGRVPGFGVLWRLTHVYEDGRLITGWFGGSVNEQHLTPEGVDLMRSNVLSGATLLDPDLDDLDVQLSDGGPGAEHGSLQLQVGKQRFQVAWSDPILPTRITDPDSWLPESAWADPRAMPYVTPTFAVCMEYPQPSFPEPPVYDARLAAQAFEQLPEAIQGLIRSRAIVHRPDDVRCPYHVATAEARVIADVLDSLSRQEGVLEWRNGIEFLRVLPDRETEVCNCG